MGPSEAAADIAALECVQGGEEEEDVVRAADAPPTESWLLPRESEKEVGGSQLPGRAHCSPKVMTQRRAGGVWWCHPAREGPWWS